MKLNLKKGSTSNILQIFIADSSSTTGAGLTGLAFNSGSLTAYYHRDTDTTATAMTLVTMTVGTFTSLGFKEIDATNMPGWYQFCPPNAAVASGAKSVAFHLKGATNMAPLPIEVQLVAYDPDDAAALGLTNLDTTVSSRSSYAGGDTSGTTTLLSRLPSAITLSGGAVTVGTNNDKTGYGLSAAAVQAVWDALTSALTTVGSIGKLLVTNIDAAISSRMATFSYTTPPTVAAIRTEMDSNSTKLANLDATVSSRSTYAGGAVASVTAGVTVTTNNDKTGYALTSGEHTNVVADVNTALDAAGTELSAVPGATGTLRQKINMIFQYLVFKRTTTATTETAFKADSSTTLGTSTVSDDGTTATHGKVS